MAEITLLFSCRLAHILSSLTYTKAQAAKLDKILRLHNEYKARHGKLKKELHLYQEENEALECRVAQLEECEDQVDELISQNEFLENKVQELCQLMKPKEEETRSDIRLMTQQLQKKQRAYELLLEENVELRQHNTQLDLRLNSEERCADVWAQLDLSQQQCSQKETELKHAKEMLKAQVENNQALQEQTKELQVKAAQENQIKELSTKVSQRLDRIQQLEHQNEMNASQRPELSPQINTNPTMQDDDTNSIEVTVYNASLQVPQDAQSFVLIDFHSFESTLSNIAKGNSPTYDFSVIYEVEVNRFLLHSFAKGFVQIELYVLQKDDISPTLFAKASVSTSSLLHSSPAEIKLLRLELRPLDEGKGNVGSLSMSMKMAKPLAGVRSSLDFA